MKAYKIGSSAVASSSSLGLLGDVGGIEQQVALTAAPAEEPALGAAVPMSEEFAPAEFDAGNADPLASRDARFAVDDASEALTHEGSAEAMHCPSLRVTSENRSYTGTASASPGTDSRGKAGEMGGGVVEQGGEREVEPREAGKVEE